MYVVYAFGNGYLLSNMFMAIAAFFANGNTYALLEGLVLISYIFLVIRVIVTGNHFHLKTMFMYTGGFAVVYLALISVQVNVNVQDISNPGSPTNAQVISSVPIGIAEPWSLVTTAQYALAQDFQNTFSVPNGDNLLENGIGVSLMNDETTATISPSNSYLYEDYNMYIQNCIAPGIATGNISASALFSAGSATDTSSLSYQANNAYSVWNIMSAYTSGAGSNMLTNWYSGTNSSSTTEQASGQSDPQGITTTCGQETVWIQSAVQDYINGPLMNSMAGALQFATVSELSNAIGAINPYIYNMQQSSMNMLYQSIGANMYSPAILKMAQISGANADSLAVATGTAVQSTTSGLIESGILAGKYMPIVFGLFEALMLGVCVILLILGITHLGHGYIKMMFQFLIMIMIWPSLVVIFNYISQLIIQAQFSGYSGLGYSIGSSGAISSYLSESLAWMGYFSWSVPMVAYAIASNSSYAMVSMVGGMESSITRNASIPGANALSKGDFEAGVVKDNMMTANSFNATNQANVGVGATKVSSAPRITQEKSITQDGWTITQTVNSQGQVVSGEATKGGVTVDFSRENGKLQVTSSSAPLELKANESQIESAEKAYTTSASETMTKLESLNSELTKLRGYESRDTYTQGGVVTTGKEGGHGIKQNTKVGENQTVDGKSTASLSIGPFSLNFANSNSLMNSHGNSDSAVVGKQIQKVRSELENYIHSGNTAHINTVNAALKDLNSFQKSFNKTQSIASSFHSMESKGMVYSANAIPSVLNSMAGDHQTAFGFLPTLNKFVDASASSEGITSFGNMAVKTANPDMKNLGPEGINNIINKKSLEINNSTSGLNSEGFLSYKDYVDEQYNSGLGNLKREYGNKKSEYSTEFSKPINENIISPTVGNVPHGNPWVSHFLQNDLYPVAVADVGFVNGATMGLTGDLGITPQNLAGIGGWHQPVSEISPYTNDFYQGGSVAGAVATGLYGNTVRGAIEGDEAASEGLNIIHKTLNPEGKIPFLGRLTLSK